MSASKVRPSKIEISPSESNPQTLLNLASSQVYFRKNGIEFRTSEALPVWTEMTVDLQTASGKQLTCNGVVVACTGNRHTGYVVAMVFTSLNPRTQAQLEEFAIAGS